MHEYNSSRGDGDDVVVGEDNGDALVLPRCLKGDGRNMILLCCSATTAVRVLGHSSTLL